MATYKEAADALARALESGNALHTEEALTLYGEAVAAESEADAARKAYVDPADPDQTGDGSQILGG